MAYSLAIRTTPLILTTTAMVHCGVSSTSSPESVDLEAFGVVSDSAVVTVDLDLEYLWVLWPSLLGLRTVVVGGLDQTGAFTTPTLQAIGGVDYYVCRSNQRLTYTGLELTLGAA